VIVPDPGSRRPRCADLPAAGLTAHSHAESRRLVSIGGGAPSLGGAYVCGRPEHALPTRPKRHSWRRRALRHGKGKPSGLAMCRWIAWQARASRLTQRSSKNRAAGCACGPATRATCGRSGRIDRGASAGGQEVQDSIIEVQVAEFVPRRDGRRALDDHGPDLG
jgi:hypothetical protein